MGAGLASALLQKIRVFLESFRDLRDHHIWNMSHDSWKSHAIHESLFWKSATVASELYSTTLKSIRSRTRFTVSLVYQFNYLFSLYIRFLTDTLTRTKNYFAYSFEQAIVVRLICRQTHNYLFWVQTNMSLEKHLKYPVYPSEPRQIILLTELVKHKHDSRPFFAIKHCLQGLLHE